MNTYAAHFEFNYMSIMLGYLTIDHNNTNKLLASFEIKYDDGTDNLMIKNITFFIHS